MAEIPVEKKSNMSWLWILLALVAAALLAWWLLADNDRDEVRYNDTDIVATAPANEMGADTVSALAIGETVNLDNVRVSSLAGDMAFNADINGENMLVLFNQVPTPNDATEGEYDINPGSMVNISGTVRSAAEALPANVDAEIPAGTERYIFADSIEMVE